MVLQTTPMYETEKMENLKLRTRTRTSYEVLDFKVDQENGGMLLKIKRNLPDSGKRVEVFVPRLRNLEDDSDSVRIYDRIPAEVDETVPFRTVARQTLISRTPVGEGETTGLAWDRVELVRSETENYWVYSNSGIYRADLSKRKMDALYASLRKGGFSYSRTVLILGGYVNAGFSSKWVELAWGKPQAESRTESGAVEWSYPDRKVYFKNGRVSLIVYADETAESSASSP